MPDDKKVDVLKLKFILENIKSVALALQKKTITVPYAVDRLASEISEAEKVFDNAKTLGMD